jgi:hypothetical protein
MWTAVHLEQGKSRDAADEKIGMGFPRIIRNPSSSKVRTTVRTFLNAAFTTKRHTLLESLQRENDELITALTGAEARIAELEGRQAA